MGHVRDLPKSKLGVDEKKGFKPDYRVLPAKKKVLDELKKAAEKSDSLYIATDPDREGEAIGWHLAEELGMPKAKTFRIMFNEITERAVKAAFLHPGKIDAKKVNAQQARRADGCARGERVGEGRHARRGPPVARRALHLPDSHAGGGPHARLHSAQDHDAGAAPRRRQRARRRGGHRPRHLHAHRCRAS